MCMKEQHTQRGKIISAGMDRSWVVSRNVESYRSIVEDKTKAGAKPGEEKQRGREGGGGGEKKPDTTPVLVDELCHACATCGKVNERDLVSSDGTKWFCSFVCKLKDDKLRWQFKHDRAQSARAPQMKK